MTWALSDDEASATAPAAARTNEIRVMAGFLQQM
jgi:hypothetical protein